MIIKLSPVCSDTELVVQVYGDKLILNGVEFDFGPLPEGSTLPLSAINSEWINEDVHRTDGEIEVTIIAPHVHGASVAARFPVPINVTEDGEVELPV